MLFQELSCLFNQISLVTSRIEMMKLLANLLDKSSPFESKLIAYFVMGKLYPSYISIQFAIAEKNMVLILANFFQESELSIKNRFAISGDYGSLFDNNINICDANLTIEYVYNSLVQIASLSGIGSQEKKNEAVCVLLENLDSLSAKYVVRIIMGSLRLGVSDMTFLDALSLMVTGDKSLRGDLEHAYNICADLGLIAYTLKTNGIAVIRNMLIQVGIPIIPAAAERLPNACDIFKKIGPCVVQQKLDGFRLQVHIDMRDKNNVKVYFFSRNLIDMSYMFPDLVDACLLLNVQTLIVEGEAVVCDFETQQIVSFQKTVKRKRKYGITKAAEDLPLRLYLFDVLYVDGVSLLNETHVARRIILEKIINQNNMKSLCVIQECYVNSEEELENAFINAMEVGIEGIIAKKKNAIYQPGKRNFNWIKLKYQCADKMNDTIDVVILGYYYGQGRRAKYGIGALLVGLYNIEKDCFETIAKLGTGFSDLELIDIKNMCDQYCIEQCQYNVICDKSLYPDVWVLPHIVCEILADQITVSPVHTVGKTLNSLGFALRFPRFIKVRSDKLASQSTTLQEICNLYNA